DQAVDRTERNAVDELLDEIFHASAGFRRFPSQMLNRGQMQRQCRRPAALRIVTGEWRYSVIGACRQRSRVDAAFGLGETAPAPVAGVAARQGAAGAGHAADRGEAQSFERMTRQLG